MSRILHWRDSNLLFTDWSWSGGAGVAWVGHRALVQPVPHHQGKVKSDLILSRHGIYDTLDKGAVGVSHSFRILVGWQFWLAGVGVSVGSLLLFQLLRLTCCFVMEPAASHLGTVTLYSRTINGDIKVVVPLFLSEDGWHRAKKGILSGFSESFPVTWHCHREHGFHWCMESHPVLSSNFTTRIKKEHGSTGSSCFNWSG